LLRAGAAVRAGCARGIQRVPVLVSGVLVLSRSLSFSLFLGGVSPPKFHRATRRHESRPANKLMADFVSEGFNAVTLDTLLGLHVGEEDTDKAHKMHIADYTAIVFDEIFFHGVSKLMNSAPSCGGT